MKRSPEEKKVLEMLSAGKIGVEDAERLLDKLREPTAEAAAAEPADGRPGTDPSRPKPKYLRIDCCDSAGKEDVNLRIPLGFVRGGVRLAALLPESVQSRVKMGIVGAGVSDLFGDDLLRVVDELDDLDIDIRDGGETVRIYCE